jgi:hypothetical protein
MTHLTKVCSGNAHCCLRSHHPQRSVPALFSLSDYWSWSWVFMLLWVAEWGKNNRSPSYSLDSSKGECVQNTDTRLLCTVPWVSVLIMSPPHPCPTPLLVLARMISCCQTESKSAMWHGWKHDWSSQSHPNYSNVSCGMTGLAARAWIQPWTLLGCLQLAWFVSWAMYMILMMASHAYILI